MGGISLTFVGHPFDTVKVCMQTQSRVNPVYKNSIHCAQSIWRNEGLRGYYKGVASPLAGQMFFQAMKFAAYGQSLRVVKNAFGTEQLDGFGFFCAGFMAQAFGSLVCRLCCMLLQLQWVTCFVSGCLCFCVVFILFVKTYRLLRLY